MKYIRNLIIVSLFCLTALPLTVFADKPDYSDFNYMMKQVTDKIHVIFGPLEMPDKINHGFRNNVVIVTTSKGIVVMDPGGSAWAGEMVAGEIKQMFDRPVVAVFDSHAHGDHWLGNEGIKRHFPNAVIYGHPMMKARLEGNDGPFWLETINRVTENTADGKQVVAPDTVVNDGDVITIGDTAFRIFHTGKAHTDNDIMIEIVGENALFVGDVVRNHFLGIMEDDSSFKGNIAAIDKIAAMNFQYYIPGHGSVGSADMALAYKSYLVSLRNTVKELFDEGMADYEMKPQVNKSLGDYSDWTGFDLRLGAHISRCLP